MEKFLQMHKEEEEEVAICPSFNSYSRDGIAEVAARVQTEVNQQPDDEEDTFEFSKDFDFSSSTMASQIRLVYPVFNRDLMQSEDDDRRRNRNQDHDRDTEFRAGEVEGDNVARARLSLKNLFVDETDHPSSCLSSKADELDKMPTGTYCFWILKSPSPSKSPGRCKKSNSTGSCSKRWCFVDLLKRSNSDGKADSLKATVAAVKTKVKGETVAAPYKAFYVNNKAAKGKGGDKRRSYLPYRVGLLGFFSGNIPMLLTK